MRRKMARGYGVPCDTRSFGQIQPNTEGRIIVGLALE